MIIVIAVDEFKLFEMEESKNHNNDYSIWLYFLLDNFTTFAMCKCINVQLAHTFILYQIS